MLNKILKNRPKRGMIRLNGCKNGLQLCDERLASVTSKTKVDSTPEDLQSINDTDNLRLHVRGRRLEVLIFWNNRIYIRNP